MGYKSDADLKSSETTPGLTKHLHIQCCVWGRLSEDEPDPWFPPHI